VVDGSRQVDAMEREAEGRLPGGVEEQPGADRGDPGGPGEQRGAAVGGRPENGVCGQARHRRHPAGGGVGTQQVDRRDEVAPGADPRRPRDVDPRHEHRVAPGPGGDPQPEVEVGRPDVEADRVRRRVGGPPDDEGELGEPGVELLVVVEHGLDPGDEGSEPLGREVDQRQWVEVVDVAQPEHAGQPHDVAEDVVIRVEGLDLLAQETDDELQDVGADRRERLEVEGPRLRGLRSGQLEVGQREREAHCVGRGGGYRELDRGAPQVCRAGDGRRVGEARLDTDVDPAARAAEEEPPRQ